MRTLIFGAGPLGILYAHLLHEASVDVTILARGATFELIEKRKLDLVNGFNGERAIPGFKVIDHLSEDDNYDLVVVLVRKNKIPSVLETLGECSKLANILFMGNNVLGFDAYLEKLPAEKVLFGFPGAGGGWDGDAVEYVDREAAKEDRMPIRIGEIDGVQRERTVMIRALFEGAGIAVEVVDDIDGWLKYHAAFVVPIGMGIYRHDCDLRALAADRESLRLMVGACKECGNVLNESGYTKRQPFKFNLFYWMPEFVTAKIFRDIFESRYAEVAFAKHAEAARDEFELLANEFQSLSDQTTVQTPLFEILRHNKRRP
jgi:2-dehydropantoate 2-reductase